MLAFRRWTIGKPGLSGHLPRGVAQFSPPQGIKQITRKENTLSLPADETFAREMFEATAHGIPHFHPETASHDHWLAREKLAIQPRRARRGGLLLQGKVRPDRKGEFLPALSVLIGARLDDRTGRSIAG